MEKSKNQIKYAVKEDVFYKPFKPFKPFSLDPYTLGVDQDE